MTPRSKTFYDRERAEGKKHNAAIICLARRRCDVILAILRDHEPCLTPAEREVREAALQAARGRNTPSQEHLETVTAPPGP